MAGLAVYRGWNAGHVPVDETGSVWNCSFVCDPCRDPVNGLVAAGDVPELLSGHRFDTIGAESRLPETSARNPLTSPLSSRGLQ